MVWIYPTTVWKEYKSKKKVESLTIDKNFYAGFSELY
jgi:hypothetical protein